jgi:hypothetical protein
MPLRPARDGQGEASMSQVVANLTSRQDLSPAPGRRPAIREPHDCCSSRETATGMVSASRMPTARLVPDSGQADQSLLISGNELCNALTAKGIRLAKAIGIRWAAERSAPGVSGSCGRVWLERHMLAPHAWGPAEPARSGGTCRGGAAAAVPSPASAGARTGSSPSSRLAS